MSNLILSFDSHMHMQWQLTLFDNNPGADVIKSRIRRATFYGYGAMANEHDNIIKRSHPFIQGDSSGWLMIEFWCKDQIDIINACIVLSECCNIPLEIK